MTATLIEMLLLRQTEELVLIPLPPELESNARDSLREEERVLLNFNIMVIPRHGSMIAIQAEMFRLKPMVELESMPQLLQELVLSAKDLLKRNLIALPSIMVTPKLGSMIAIQEEMFQFKPMEVQESMPQLLQESVLNAKDLLKWKREEILKREPRVLHNTTETLRHGLMLVIQPEMCLLRPTQVVLEHGKLDKMDHSQELELNAKDSLKDTQDIKNESDNLPLKLPQLAPILKDLPKYLLTKSTA